MCEKIYPMPLDFFTKEEKLEMLKEYVDELEIEKRHIKEIIRRIDGRN